MVEEILIHIQTYQIRGLNGQSLWYYPLVQAKFKEREKHFPFSKMGIKTGLVIHKNVKKTNLYH